MPGVEFLLVRNDGVRVPSAGWRTLAGPPVELALAAPLAPGGADPAGAAGALGAAFELTINFELAHFMYPARRPYVAVWIDGKDHRLVRMLALWYQKARYLEDL